MDIYIPNIYTHILILNVEVDDNTLLVGMPNKRKVNFYYELRKGDNSNLILPQLNKDYENMLSKLNIVNQIKGIALEDAETNLNFLTQFLIEYYKTRDYPADLRPLKQLDFMGKRDILSNYIVKKDKLFWEIPELATKQLRKDFTTKFNNYILNRNIFAHGILVIWLEKESLYIEHIDQVSKKKAYAQVTDTVFKEFHFHSEYLKKVLVKMESRIKT